MLGDDYLGIESRLQALSKKKSKSKNYLNHAVIGALILAVPLVYLIDTRVFPVVGPAHAIIISQNPVPGTIKVRFVYTKYRNCKFIGSSFWLRGHTSTPVQLLQSGPAINNPVGRTTTGVMVLGVDQDSWINNGQMIVEHRCHPFWTHQANLYE